MAKKVKKKVAKKVTKRVAKKVTKKKVAPMKVSKKTAKKQSASVIKSGIPQVGEMAPEFTLTDQNGKTVSLKDFRGQNVVVYFYPKAMTPGCTVQACSLTDARADLKENNIVVLGISADPQKKLKQFEEKYHLNFTLLSDEDHKVTEAYGSWGLKKFMGREFMGILRQSFLVNKEGKIVHVMHKVDTKTHHQDVIDLFKRL
jgi:peroxiredoxin Q/BCP